MWRRGMSFVAIYGPLVHRLAMRQGLQAADAEDVVQQVFAAVAQSCISGSNAPSKIAFVDGYSRLLAT